MDAKTLKPYLLDHNATVYPTVGAKQRLAAVLILLTPGDDGPELIFTRRSEHLPSHAGQISFPGGTVEPDDASPIETALRESEEEIGLNRAYVDILGTLDWYTIPSGFVVLPVIGHLSQKQKFKAAPEEVAEIFSIPLRTLLDTSIYKSDTFTRNKIKRRYYFFEFKEYYIWGATAGMLRSLALKLSD
ncbi:CoA pyrophosphatase [Haliea sp. AH-315-K21]|uniref:CoA pyrophosphatase n=1 Tax=SAR86 cluster bacterium TaxID=2030880 RepID=A0A2A5CF28_9GAMM|nr:CoA pyrophosphatase [Haliea sp. AH-315-K21]MBN4076016.1 CoA pyrophosphatase [Gammaproteobacteria bacterium AH-315-E17]PCJ42070.1 MAG: CoA pyrophosphatase [SAR86 cluster bacterium]